MQPPRSTSGDESLRGASDSPVASWRNVIARDVIARKARRSRQNRTVEPARLGRAQPADPTRSWENSDARLPFRSAHAARGRRRFALIAVLAIALGIGGSTTMFSAINALLLRPMPLIQDQDRLLAVAQYLTKKPDLDAGNCLSGLPRVQENRRPRSKVSPRRK